MAESPKVTIIIPVYNVEPYLRECLDSVFSQTYQNIEVICVDDGSTDGSPQILTEYASRYSNLTVLSQENGGVSSARNLALNHVDTTSDDYLMFVDADDCLEPVYVERMVTAALDRDADIVASSFTFYRDDRRSQFVSMNSLFGDYSAADATKLLIEDRSIQSHSHCKLYKSKTWDGVCFPVGIIYMEDQATIYKPFCKANKVSIISEYGYLYRQRADSVCGKPISNQKVVNALDMYRSVYEYPFEEFNESEQGILRNAALQAYANCFLMVYPRFDRKNATEQDLSRFFCHCRRVNSERIISFFAPCNKKERLKKGAYLFARPFYRLLYKLFSGKN